ncbi:YoaK family protein [Sphingosinicella sp. BN140058]|uniref:YoaK family protein n=1 Tax=Sphingosinicella sp. BN140058 TaxID=1892855 RepID=UPI0010109C21|nr:DUF1275 family protein [Sphingosinicella sp. BN140058]QAY78723.1 DUF1275 domain-containing protein [Sphingosinicella sp. BN140058]
MMRYDTRLRGLAILLSAMAGYVDAIAFLELGGFFVSFMSGNSTRLAVGVAHLSPSAWIAAGLIASFVAGAALGSLIGEAAGGNRRAAVLALVAGALAIGSAIGILFGGFAAAALVALAMGAENAVFEEQGEVRIGLTYMSGTLVKLGQSIAALLRGTIRPGWASLVLLWTGFLAGAIGGASARPWLGLGGSLAVAAGFAACAATITWRFDTKHNNDSQIRPEPARGFRKNT